MYPLAKQGVFLTLQGEGVFFGTPMVFVRLAGCDVNCAECDTDYRIVERVESREIVRRCLDVGGVHRWVWLTGGEPTIHDLDPLVRDLRQYGFRVALATAGEREVKRGSVDGWPGVNFVSVSPHNLQSWNLRRGDQLNVVPGLGGLKLSDLEDVDVSGFARRFVTPFWYEPEQRMESVRECVEWVQTHPGWRLGIQAHKFWGVL